MGRSKRSLPHHLPDLPHQVLPDELIRCVEHALNRIEDILAAAPVLADDAGVDAAQEFVCVRIGLDGARKHDVRGAPTILILDDRDNEMSRAPGLMETEKLLVKLAETRRGKTTSGSSAQAAFARSSNVSLPAPLGPTTRMRRPGPIAAAP